MISRPIALVVLALTGSAAAASHETTNALELSRSPASFSRAALTAPPFEITDDENAAFRLRVGGQVQFRYVANFRDTDDTADDHDYAGGFEARRTKINFSGTTLSKDLSFRVLAAFDRSGDGTFRLEEAWLRYKLGDGWSVRAGQFKLPFLREENVSSTMQLAADRSVANEVFNQDFAQAVEFTRESEWWRVLAAVSDGFASRNTSFFSPKEADVALTGRVERRVGEAPWKSYDDFTSFRDSPTGWMVGGAFHWQHTGDTAAFSGGAPVAVTEADMISYTLDLSVEGGGWNFFAACVGRWTDAAGVKAWDDFGAVVQGGYFFTERTEGFARWDAVFPDKDRAGPHDNFHTLAAGLNHYFIEASHAAKLTIDVQVFLDDQAGSSSVVSPQGGIGMLPSTESGQVAVRVQMQLLF
ncbi:MAG: hypothetical protein KIS87_11290 [Phycisphaeraceae bacterium]|nr:hypothetical protein [Phycisphaeraceae bacterium]